ncbi:hypothetical protein A5886_002055 [Enterococcus sp. 8G7_MSG3316]|uniref:Uncharacterized protein n=1 Tax=Candidatus Enterococcus testudinis TaxID=1834191 RepID=A0A242A7G4_9ENTE|nr:DUF6270 domain-containing protein [Enterococcus sp. 8G7_MSG3316]OTN76976.1 hypothetical protein A5886_002055 [Enterococcus sp. 8G7_MSG3316]
MGSKLKSWFQKKYRNNFRKTMPYKVALLGSCTTRDIFNSKFNPDYKRYFTIVADQQHMSIVSVMSSPLNLKESKINGDVTNFYKNVYRQDLQKDFLSRLKQSQPDILIIDFYTDVFYGTLAVNDGTYITNKKWQYKKLDHFKQINIENEYSIYNNTDAFLKLWKKNFDDLIQYVRLNLPHCEIILNKTKFVNTGLKNGQQVVLSEELNDKWENFHIDRFNILWDLFDTYAEYKFNLRHLDFDIKQYYCPSDHPWGWFYVHYNQEFYSKTLGKLRVMLD